MGKLKDLTGMKFGRLLVINRAENVGHNVRWDSMCNCENKTMTTSYNFRLKKEETNNNNSR